MPDLAEPSTLFAAPVLTPEAASARVRDDLERRFGDRLPAGVDVGALARAAVDELWRGRVRLFVPVLALRLASDAVERAQPPQPPLVSSVAAVRAARSGPDVALLALALAALLAERALTLAWRGGDGRMPAAAATALVVGAGAIAARR